MVIYNLICEQKHEFEGWFPSAEGFQDQLLGNQVSCPECGITAVQKLPHACAIRTNKEPSKERSRSIPTQAKVLSESDARELLLRAHHHVQANFEDVGSDFAEQAQKMFKGEVEKKSIYGTATSGERDELDTEGVPYVVLPKPELDS